MSENDDFGFLKEVWRDHKTHSPYYGVATRSVFRDGEFTVAGHNKKTGKAKFDLETGIGDSGYVVVTKDGVEVTVGQVEGGTPHITPEGEEKIQEIGANIADVLSDISLIQKYKKTQGR